ncbi:MAG: zinc ribbon domain-containing protein [Ruminococcus sp.]|nr:zinc ribbon domain-containing protein [Ruminococcus sp.]
MENEESKVLDAQTEKEFCVKCGFQLPQDCDFCPKCGTPKGNAAEGQSGEKKKSKKWIVILIIVIVVLAALAVGAYFLFFNDKDEDDADNSFTSKQLQTANSNAKAAYNAVAEYIADEEVMGRIEADVIEEIAGSHEVKDGEDGTFEHEIYEELGDIGGEIYIDYPVTVNDWETFVVQWRNTSESGAIGQYPNIVSSINISVDWGTYCSDDVEEVQTQTNNILKEAYTKYCTSEFSEVASDGSYLSIDTNPEDEEDENNRFAWIAITSVNSDLGLPDSLEAEMKSTSAFDGKQTEEFSDIGVSVTWSYSAYTGLEVMYKLMS